MKIIAAVPTYNRPELLLKNIDCLLRQTRPLDRIVIVDNASEAETRQVMERAGYLSHPLIEYIRVDVNVGASGGFGIGMETAMAQGADWIWGMDDDAFPHSDALEQLLAANISGEHDCLWSNVDEDTEFDAPTKQVDVLIFVGYLVSRKLVEVVGYPDRRFYMYHDDTDYSKRIIEHGFGIVKVRDSVIDHRGFNKRGTPQSTYRLPVGSFTVLNCEPFRIYYIFRNVYFTKSQGVERLRYLLRTLLVEFPKYLLTRPWSGVAIGLAAFHVLIRRRGRFDLPAVFSRKYHGGH